MGLSNEIYSNIVATLNDCVLDLKEKKKKKSLDQNKCALPLVDLGLLCSALAAFAEVII